MVLPVFSCVLFSHVQTMS